jgi:hypothetical protein
MEINTNDNNMEIDTTHNNNTNFIMNPYSDIPITEEFAPEYPYKILDNLTNVINTPGIQFDDIITFVRNQNWKGIYQLYNINAYDDDQRAVIFANNINDSLTQITDNYKSKYFTIIEENSRHQSSRLTNLFIDQTNELIDYITKKLEENIDKEKIKREKLSIINFLKGKIGEIYANNPELLYLYDLTINQYDTNNALEKYIDIQLKYTELGVILMLKTELLHDLSPPILDKETTGNLQNDLNELLNPASPFRELLIYIDEKNREKYITYTEEISTELILYISSLQGINRIYRQNDVDSVTRGEKKLGSTILPSIFNNNNISITSDADNTAALIYSQISKNMKLENNTSKIYPFLDLDAGSAPSLHGFTESFVRQGQLEILKRASDNDNDENNDDITIVPNIAGVKITIKDPSDVIMLTMENNDILNNPNYTINCTGFNSFTLNELSITNVAEKINNPPYSPSATSEISKKKKINKQSSVLNIAIIKSIGDLIPYQVVSFFRALNKSTNEDLAELLNIVSSRDYSMIFQVISNVQYFINQQDYTYNLNDKKIIVGCNLSNANAFFPFSERMNKIFNYMSIIVNDQEYINLKNDIIKNVSACFFCPINGSIKVSPKSNSNNPAIQNISANISSFLDVNIQDKNNCYINNIDNDQFILLNERYKNFLYNNDLCNFDELINKIENDNKLNKNFNIECLKKLNDKINNGVKTLYDIFTNYKPIDQDNNEYNIDNIDYCIAIKLYNLFNNQKVSSNMDTYTDRGGTKKNHKQHKKYKSYNRKNKNAKNKTNRKSKSKKHNKSKNKRKSNKTLRKHR